MGTATLTIDLDALAMNWRALDARTGCTTGAVVKANGYGLGAPAVGRRLVRQGVKTFFVAAAEEGAILRRAVGNEPTIYVFSGHMASDTDILRERHLTPLLNSVDQMLLHFETMSGLPFGIQLDTGMNRLGLEPSEWEAVRDIAMSQSPKLIMSHLACADTPEHPMNTHQLQVFEALTHGLGIPRSLAATGGILLGPKYHFDLCRPGIGLYGGLPFAEARQVIQIDVPVIQTRLVETGETVGYGNAWVARRPSRIATVAAGYADGLIRAMGASAHMFKNDHAVPVVGRVSMDLITVDVTDLPETPSSLQIIGAHQTVDEIAQAAGTIGYEILTSLGGRYTRVVNESRE